MQTPIERRAPYTLTIVARGRETSITFDSLEDVTEEVRCAQSARRCKYFGVIDRNGESISVAAIERMIEPPVPELPPAPVAARSLLTAWVPSCRHCRVPVPHPERSNVFVFSCDAFVLCDVCAELAHERQREQRRDLDPPFEDDDAGELYRLHMEELQEWEDQHAREV